MFWGYTRHGKEKSQKCNQCDFACHNQGNLKVHFRIHNGEKPYHCNQCDFACSKASNLNVHVKTHSGEKSNATSVTIHLPLLVIWKVIWKHTLAKSAINANCATLQPLKLVIWIDTCWRTVVLILGFWRTRIVDSTQIENQHSGWRMTFWKCPIPFCWSETTKSTKWDNRINKMGVHFNKVGHRNSKGGHRNNKVGV